jgi:CRP-like cAMP-binding protein
MSTATLRRLRALELFAGLGRSDLARIDRLGMMLEVPRGKTLCRDGEIGREFFVLTRGLAEVCGTNHQRALLHEGAWFGEGALLDNVPRRATVTAVLQSTVLVLDRREFAGMVREFPAVRARLEASVEEIVRHRDGTRFSWYQPITPVAARLVPSA